jgi:Cation efflux family
MCRSRMRLGLIANYSGSVENRIHEGALLPSGTKAAPFFAADKPADADYRFGHAKIEAVATLAQTGFLVALSVGVAVQAIERIRGAAAVVDANAFAIGVVVFSITVDLTRWRALSHVAPDLEPCARRQRAALFKRPHLVRAGALRPRRDARRLSHAHSLAAIDVAGSIAVAGYRSAWATIDALVDRAPDGQTGAMRPRHPNARSRRDGGDPAHQRRTDRRRSHRFGAPHAAAGTGGGGSRRSLRRGAASNRRRQI